MRLFSSGFTMDWLDRRSDWHHSRCAWPQEQWEKRHCNRRIGLFNHRFCAVYNFLRSMRSLRIDRVKSSQWSQLIPTAKYWWYVRSETVMLSDRFEFEMFPSVSLFGKIIPMYGLCMVLGIILSCSVAFARAKKFKLDINNLIVIAAAAVGGGLICAKILYIAVTFRLSDILSMIANGSFDFILQSGLVYYGGLIGGILTAFLTVKLLKEDVDKVVLSIVPCIPLGHSFGRLGCLFAGCCYGSFPDPSRWSRIEPVPVFRISLHCVKNKKRCFAVADLSLCIFSNQVLLGILPRRFGERDAFRFINISVDMYCNCACLHNLSYNPKNNKKEKNSTYLNLQCIVYTCGCLPFPALCVSCCRFSTESFFRLSVPSNPWFSYLIVIQLDIKKH